MSKNNFNVESSELGKKSEYAAHYNPDKLFPIPRQAKRQEIGIDSGKLPFHGFDCWNHYEVSWLNENGKPVVAMAEIIYSSDSTHIIESKSMKLYFNSFNNTKFKNHHVVAEIIKRDFEPRVGGEVLVTITPLSEMQDQVIHARLSGESIDHLDVVCDIYTVSPELLVVENLVVTETLCSDLLKSNCLVTSQPDWGSVQITYTGKKINRESLLKYIVSFRNHDEFHEQCIERIFVDIMRICQPECLAVYGRYTRRGGLDINPYRSSTPVPSPFKQWRLCRQ
jgi:7-cyano-7-deazaguanine reductase